MKMLHGILFLNANSAQMHAASISTKSWPLRKTKDWSAIVHSCGSDLTLLVDVNLDEHLQDFQSCSLETKEQPPSFLLAKSGCNKGLSREVAKKYI